MKESVLRRLLSTTIALAAITGGCAAPAPGGEAPIRSQAQALNGTVTYDAAYPCTPARRLKISAAVGVLQQHVLTTPDPLRDCLRNAIFALAPHSFAERVMSELAANVATEVQCADAAVTPCNGLTGWSTCHPRGITGEVLRFSNAYLDSLSTQDLAGEMLVGVLRNRGYGTGEVPERQHSAGEQASACLAHVIDPTTFPGPNGLSRADMTREAELQQVGGDGGDPLEHFCAEGDVVNGARFHLAAPAGPNGVVTITGIQTSCRPLEGFVGAFEPLAGSAGATAALQMCTPSEVLVGLVGRAMDRVNRLSFVCALLSDVRAGRLAPVRTVPSVGGPTMGPPVDDNVERRCPPGMAVRAILGRAGADLDQIRLVCERVDAVPNGVPNALAALGGLLPGANAITTRNLCSSNGALVRLFGRVGFGGDGSIEHLGGECTALARTSDKLGAVVGPPQHLPANGPVQPNGSYPMMVGCSDNAHAIVGINAGTDLNTGGISFVSPRCADIEAWDDTSQPVATVDGFGAGNNFGNVVTQTCPRGQFVAGLEVTSETLIGRRHVDTIIPLCRAFR